jgi:putative CocE/NonD family hydrolase
VEKNQFDLDFDAEVHRWFDYWLKGIENGIMNEPPIYYYVMGDSKKDAWRTCTQWPLPNQKLTRFYFDEGKTGSVASINDGFLRSEPQSHKDAADVYKVDYSTTSGKSSRWYAVNWPRHYPDMRANDEKALSYTTPPLESTIEVTGHPIANLWFSTEAPDLDVFVYLEEVDSSGKSTYITEGNLRASHRKVSKAPYNNFALPYHSHYQSDLMPIPSREPMELVFKLLSTSHRFHQGNRIRITIAFADADNFETPVVDPAPKIHLLRDGNHQSSIQLPVVQTQ